MSRLPREPEAFAERVGRLLAGRLGGAVIEVVGPLDLRIGEEFLDLRDLYRAVTFGGADPDEAVDSLADCYLKAAHLADAPMPFDLVRPRILPRIERYEFFAHRKPEFVAHQPFVNDTVIVYIVDLQGAIRPVETEQLIRWDMDVEELDALARQNLAARKEAIEIQVFRGEEGTAAVLQTGDGYDAARLLLEPLYGELAPELGGDYLVAIPTRDVFLAFGSESREFLDRVKRRITQDYRKLPFPITDGLFLVTRDGVAGWSEAA